ncbi:MAG: hypothetical protein M1813_008465 [Trichoglossum hirsutum]|nr:MAG: hypothetical protein M1813_008465 [Trichoglossum hirsutum]
MPGGSPSASSLSSVVLQWLERLPSWPPIDQPLKRHGMGDSASPGSQGAKKRRVERNAMPDSGSSPAAGSPTPRAPRRIPARTRSIGSFNSGTATSSSAGGQPSTPTRAKRIVIQSMDQLELAEPSVVFELAWPVPHPIRTLQDILASNNARVAFVPNLPALQQILSVQALPDILIKPSDPTPADHELFRHALAIWRLAADVNDAKLDEQNWYPVELPPEKASPSSKQPAEVAVAVGGVKIDHLLAFNNNHPALRIYHEDLRRAVYSQKLPTPSPCSPLANDIAKNWFVFVVSEVKAGDQTALKAESQLALAAPAVLEAIEGFSVGCDCVEVCECQDWDPTEQPPVVGLIVDKHKWEMRIEYWDGKKKIRITPPAHAGHTTSFEGACRLLFLMRSLKDWAEETLVPFLISRLQARTRAMANEGSDGDSELEGGDD